MAISYVPTSDDLPTVQLALSLAQSCNLDHLERRFRAGFGRVGSASVYGFNLVHSSTSTLERNLAVNVSSHFTQRYERDALETDPLRLTAISSGRAVYNLALMEEVEWEESDVYRSAFSIHRIRQVIEAPIVGFGGSPIGGIHIAAVAGEPDFGESEMELVETFGRVIGVIVENLRARERVEAERDVARSALELSSTAVVISSPGDPEPQLNSAAKRLLETILDADAALHQLLARPASEGGFSRRVEVRLRDGDEGTLSGHSAPVESERRVATVLELRREGKGQCAAPLGVLTSRESEIAVLVSEGLRDREIAGCLHLSPHTVSQYVKRLYRKLEVDSRVGLTRLLLGAPTGSRRARRT